MKGSRGAEDAVEDAVREARRRLGAACYRNRPIEQDVVDRLLGAGRRVTTAESLTGGLVAEMLTRVPGASEVFRGGWVAYSDAFKHRELGVDRALLAAHGAVSEPVARAMAEGARARAEADWALATTGLAGPGDGQAPDGTPIAAGTFYVALAAGDRPTQAARHRHPGGRTTVQRRAAVLALDLLRRAL